MTTTYKVIFRPKAKKRFDKLDTAVQRQLARKLDERRRNPRVPGDALSHMPNCYKIKLRARGIRMIYQVQDEIVLLLVLAVGGRENEDAYIEAARELASLDD